MEFTREFWYEIRSEEGFNGNLLIIAILSAFSFNVFLVDINNFYKKIQQFFFHSTFFSYLIPSILIVLGIVYFFLPKVFNKTFDRNLFVFLGSFIATNHLIFVARENKGYTFTAFINYLFLFSIFFILILILFIFYLNIGFNIPVGDFFLNGFKKGTILIQNILTQTFR